MTGDEYERMTVSQMATKRWRTTRELRTYHGLVIPAGLPVRITGKRNGLTIEGDPCSSCGVQVIAKRCSPGSVEEVTDASP